MGTSLSPKSEDSNQPLVSAPQLTCPIQSLLLTPARWVFLKPNYRELHSSCSELSGDPLPHCLECSLDPLSPSQPPSLLRKCLLTSHRYYKLSLNPAISPTQQAEITLHHILCRYCNNPVQKSCSTGWKVPSRQDLCKWSSDAHLLTWASGTQHSVDVPQVHECIFQLTKHSRPSLG